MVRFESDQNRDDFFPAEAYLSRLAAVRSLMSEKGYDVFITGCPQNICYLCGYVSIAVWDPQFLVIPANASPVLMIWESERGRFEASAVGVEMEGFALIDREDAAQNLARCLKTRGWLGGTIAVDISGANTRADATIDLVNGLDMTPVKGLVESLRLIKSPAEIELLREAAAITDAGVEAALEAIQAGAGDNDIAAAAASGCWRAGGEFFNLDPIATVGWRSGATHASHIEMKVPTGEPVFLEIGGVRGRYVAPMMRTAVIGEPKDPDLRELASVSIAAVKTVVDAIRPGVAAADVARKGMEVVKDVLERVWYHQIFGYPVGLSFPPTWLEESNFWITLDNPRELQVGMTFHLPLAFRIINKYGLGFSETVVVTETGAETLGNVKRELVIK